MSKKIIGLLLVLLTLTITGQIFAQEAAPQWTTQANAWKAKAGEKTYVYAVGTADWSKDITDEKYKQNRKLAIEEAVKKIKTLLSIDQVKGIQEIDTWYSDTKMFILICVPEEIQAKAVVQPAPPPTETDPCKRQDWWNASEEIFACERAGTRYVYARGTALITDEVNASTARDSAINTAKELLKTHFKVQELKDFQIANEHSGNNQIWVLGKVPAIQPPPPPPPPARDENAAFEQAVQSSGIDTYAEIPAQWWTLYGKGKKNCFISGAYLFAIGYAVPDPNNIKNNTQYWAMAKRGAENVAQRNLAAIVGTVVTTYKGAGDYTSKITGVVKGALFCADHYQTQPGPGVYVLMYIPLANVKNIQ